MKLDINEISWDCTFEYKEGKLYSKETERRADKCSVVGRYYVRYAGRSYIVSRVIWIMHNGPIPDAHEVDHIDGDPDNNIIENLRLATSAQNKWNRDHAKVSGVVSTGKRFRAQIMVKGVMYKLGKFSTEDEAHAAYQAAAKLLKGDFYRSSK